VIYTFEWDTRKAEANRKKHGVSFEEGLTVFGDPLSLNMPDPDHSESEQRFIVKTRIIGARPATRSERKSYEEG